MGKVEEQDKEEGEEEVEEVKEKALNGDVFNWPVNRLFQRKDGETA